MSTYIESVNVKGRALSDRAVMQAGRPINVITVPSLVFVQVQGYTKDP